MDSPTFSVGVETWKTPPEGVFKDAGFPSETNPVS